jgi:hypothetical protein
MWNCRCGYSGKNASTRLEHLPNGDETHVIICPNCGDENMINTEQVQLALPGVWATKQNGCPHIFQGICTQEWKICTYFLDPVESCSIFRNIVHEWSIDSGYIREEVRTNG